MTPEDMPKIQMRLQALTIAKELKLSELPSEKVDGEGFVELANTILEFMMKDETSPSIVKKLLN